MATESRFRRPGQRPNPNRHRCSSTSRRWIAGTGYLDVGLTLVSPDEDLLAYSVDTDGDEVFELRFRDLRTGEDLPDGSPRSYYGGAWSADSQWFFYTVHDEAYRPVPGAGGTGSAPTRRDDVLVLEEPDERFELNLRATRSGDLVVIWSESRSTSEAGCVDAHATRVARRGRSAAAGTASLYRVEHARRRRRPAAAWSPTTTRSSSG